MTLVSGSILAQIISVLTAPIMTRLYSPEAIGIFTYLITIVSILSPVINGKYDLAIVKEKSENNVNAIIKLAFTFGLIVSILGTIGFFCYAKLFAEEYHEYIGGTYFIFILLFITNIQNILYSFNNRKKEYKLISSVYVVRTVAQSVIMVILGLFRFSISGLLISQAVSQFLGMSHQSKSLKGELRDIYHTPINKVKLMAKLHSMQPLFAAPAALANTLSYSSVNIFIAILFGLDILGFYSISYRVLGLPLSLVSGNVSKVFFEEAARQKETTGNFYRVTIRTLLIMSVISLFMVIFMMFVIPPFFGKVFGSGWEVAGQYVKVLSPMFGIRFVTSSMSTGLIVANKQKVDFMLQILFILGSLGCYFIADIYLINTTLYLTLISVIFSMVYIGYLISIIRYSKVSV